MPPAALNTNIVAGDPGLSAPENEPGHQFFAQSETVKPAGRVKFPVLIKFRESPEKNALLPDGRKRRRDEKVWI